MAGWWRDVQGAALVQFLTVLPVLVLVIIGIWALYGAYSAQQTLCEATWQATRYLTVEGPQLKDQDYPYPAAWAQIATDIINTELKSSMTIPIKPIDVSQVEISPNTKPNSPQDMPEVRADNVPNNWFFVKASTTITNPLAVFVPGQGPDGTLALSCKRTGYFEGQPLSPTQGPAKGRKPPCKKCPIPKKCTPGPQPTVDPNSTPEDCPCPCRP
jgi:hypothetical protein